MSAPLDEVVDQGATTPDVPAVPAHALTHFRLCPFSRSVRLLLSELGLAVRYHEERPWEWRPSLLALNPSGDLPVLELKAGPILCGTYAITEYIADDLARITQSPHATVGADRAPGEKRQGTPAPLFPGNSEDRAEVRRLVDWFHRKFAGEVSSYVLEEKLYKRFRTPYAGGPDTEALRAARHNVRYHLSYISYLVDQRRWLAGDELSFADLAAAAHLSAVDYFAEVPWDERPDAKLWYARLKSRRSMRELLAERVPGAPPPPLHYDDPDF